MAPFREECPVLTVEILCPDRHLEYSGHTPDQAGVGGGVTARVRLAAALARRGHRVRVVCNCAKEEEVDGVRYVPLAGMGPATGDVAIFTTTGGKLDLRPVLRYSHRSRLRVVWVQGTQAPHGLDEAGFDFLYAPSRFLSLLAQKSWRVPPGKTFVIHNGIERRLYPRPATSALRCASLQRLLYLSHPSKGLEAAIRTFRILRKADRSFELHVFGGNRLWGGKERILPRETGLHDHGLVGQTQLSAELAIGGFSINLQSRPEPFGIALVEAMAAGCIVLASPVGAYPELVSPEHDGFLLPGPHQDASTHREASRIILDLRDKPDAFALLARNARRAPLDWDQIAESCVGHWNWALEGRGDVLSSPPCPDCGRERLTLTDGRHCVVCGSFRKFEAGD